MTDHYDEMRVSPDPLLAEELRQRLHARMASASVDDHKTGPSPLDALVSTPNTSRFQ